jgi:hypothetical protein
LRIDHSFIISLKYNIKSWVYFFSVKENNFARIDLHFFCTDKRNPSEPDRLPKESSFANVIGYGGQETPGEYKSLKLVNTTKKS